MPVAKGEHLLANFAAHVSQPERSPGIVIGEFPVSTKFLRDLQIAIGKAGRQRGSMTVLQRV